MSDITKSVLQKEINQSVKNLAEHNNADSVVKKIKSEITTLIKDTIQSANSTTSIDERMQHLVGGLQSIMTFVEDYEQKHLLRSTQLNKNVKLLQEVLQKVDQKIEEEKKDLEANRAKQLPKDI